MQGRVVSRGILHKAEKSPGPEWVGRRVTHPSMEAMGKGRELEGRTHRSGRLPPSGRELSRAGGWQREAETPISGWGGKFGGKEHDSWR